MTDNLTPTERQQIIMEISELLEQFYAFPDIAIQMIEHIQKLDKAKDYDGYKNAPLFADRLTKDLRSVQNDRHLLVAYAPELAEQLSNIGGRTALGDDYESQWWDQVHSDNFGIPKVEYLLGNIGYIELLFFAPVNLAGEVAVNAMNFLSRCDALIVDLRRCGGGDPFMVQLIESFLFSENKAPKILISQYKRHIDRTQQIWTLPYVPGRRLPRVPVYVLTSRRTFSGGEDFAYTMKHHGRATIIGQRTGGGAHPIETIALSNGFIITMPNEYPIHPVTGTNWEGTGVDPDIPVPQGVALQTAHLHALESLIRNCESGEDAHRLKWQQQRVEAIYHPFDIDHQTLAKYTGEYRDYEVKLMDKGLVLIERSNQAEWSMIAINENTFTADDDYNARFDVDETGKATAIIWISRDDEREIPVKRTDLDHVEKA